MGCLLVGSEKHVLVDCVFHLLLRRNFILVLLVAGILWKRFTVVDKVALVIDPRGRKGSAHRGELIEEFICFLGETRWGWQ